jgi:large subunit ribosomal protein L22
MQIISTQKYIIMSPTKIRPVVGLIKKMSPTQAVATLPLIRKRASLPLKKVIQSAIANAKDRGATEETLVFKEIQISEGPRLKRGMPVARGRWHPIVKRMSHIRVVLETKEIKDESKKDVTKKVESEEVSINEKVKENKKPALKKQSTTGGKQPITESKQK